MEKTPANQLVLDLERYCGVFTMDQRTADFIKEFRKVHNTNQQGIFKLMLKVMEYIASDEFRTDGRNEQSKIIAKQLLAGFQKENETAAMYDDPKLKLPSNYLPII